MLEADQKRKEGRRRRKKDVSKTLRKKTKTDVSILSDIFSKLLFCLVQGINRSK